MAARVRKASLESRAARAKLPLEERTWAVIQPGLQIGYRRGKRGGVWLTVCRADDGRRLQEKIGTADGRLDADGEAVLNF
ncbi:hypothetical protein AB4Z01_19590 [Inquilinus sp. YAF38]|uniref:hypothetical protein n=1 Tax=Inquilinus sp. YAF38 TaxID=3233084 RepID=UPI003F90FC68